MGHQIVVLDRYEIVRAVLGSGPSACPVLEDVHKETLQGAAISYEFAVPADHEDAAALAVEGYVIIRDVDENLQLFRIKTVTDKWGSDGTRVRRVVCENAALELNGAIVRPQTWTGATASQALANALSGTRWQPGVVEWAGSRTIVIDEYKTVTAVLHQIASEFGLEIRWRVEWKDGRISARYVDLLQQRGRFTGKRFEYSKDIQGAERTEHSVELCTAMVGIGKADDKGNRLTFKDVVWSKANGDPVDKPSGQDWVGDPSALERWGLPGGQHLFGLYEDPEEDNPEELLQKTWRALQDRINSKYTYEVDVVLLERVAGFEEHEKVRLGDTVTIHDTTLNPPLVLEARVIEIERSYVDPSRDRVKLGHYRPLITSIPQVVAELQRRLNQKQGVWDAKQDPVYQGPTPPDSPVDGALWLNTAQVPNVLYRYDGTLAQWVKATPTQPGEVGAEKQVTKSATAPANPAVGDLWLDTSVTPNVLKRWDGTSWVKATPTTAAEVGAEIAVTKGTTPPSNPQVGQLWLDTSTTPNAWRRWDGTQWVKATPTTASEVGAETPSGAQQKADQAEQNAKDAVASGQVPLPTSALQGAIDAALNLIKSTQAWVYMDQNGLIVYNHQDPAQATKAVRVGAGGILLANSKTNGQWNWRTAITGDGIVANEVTTGTMLFNRIRGGTAELGGSGNGNGLLIVRDASGNERARLDNAGITVTDANFLLRESRSNTIQSIVAATNLVSDHSFEMIPRSGNADADQTFAVNETYMGNLFWWQTVPGSSPLTPRVLSTYDTDYPQLALFDFQAAVVRHYNRYAWRQYVPIDQAAGYAGSYTLSAFFAAFTATSSNTTAYAEVYAVDYTLSRLQKMGTLTVSISASEKWRWKRGVVSFSNIPQSTSYLEIFIYSNPDVPILCDGVQLVPLPYPVVYNPESAVWRAQRGLAGYTNVENIYVPRSIRITRTGNLAVPSGTSVNIPWQGRYPGYSSSGMWDPAQPDTSQIFIPHTGKYLIICTVRWSSASGSGYRLLAIKVNGGNNIAKVQGPAVGGSQTYQQVSAMAHLYAGDYIQIVALQNSGTTLNLEVEAETAPVLQVIELAYPTPQL